eukprot:1949495-Ditylum_brightwellii.AAC.1
MSAKIIALSKDGRIVAVGAREANGRSRVRVYKYTGGKKNIYGSSQQQWQQIGQDIMGREGDDKFGWDISLSSDGTVLAISGRQHNDILGEKKYSGHVQVFQLYLHKSIQERQHGKKEGVQWIPMGSAIYGEYQRDFSGDSVSLSADGLTLVVGAPHDNGGCH